jgi:hypothetical protein
MGPPGWFRLMRAGVFASVCVLLSKTGHDLMASRPAPAWAGCMALGAVTAVGYCLADRRRSAWWFLLAVEVTQVCLHLWFTCCSPVGPGARLNHLGMRMSEGTRQVGGAGMPMAHGGAMSVRMVGAHALASVLVALWLYVGERALWRALGRLVNSLLGRTLRALLLLLRADLAADSRPGGAGRRWAGDEAQPVTDVLRHVVTGRGPPQAITIPFTP